MGNSVDRLSLLLLDCAIGVTALLGAVALAMIASGQPARRLTVGRLGILGSLAIVPLSSLGPISTVCLHLPIPAIPFNTPILTASILPSHILLAAIVVGLVLGLGGIVLGWLGCLRWLSRTVEPAPETEALLSSLPFQGPGPRPRARVSVRVRRPVLLGTIRPIILIPPDLEEPGQQEPLRLALLHEIAHAEQFDPFFGLLANLATSLWFFVPPLWWVRRQIRLDQEFLADRRASAKFGTGPAYASSLVGMAGTGAVSETGEGSGLRSSEVGVSALFQRILMLIRCPYPIETKSPAWWVFLWLVIVGGGTVFASGFAIRPREGGWGPPALQGLEAPKHGALHVNRLAIEAREPGPDGRVLPYTLLRRLPDRFELVVDIWADPAELSKMAIAGRCLGPLPESPTSMTRFPGFLKVRVVREPQGLRLWVADRLIPPNPLDTPPPRWLEFQPAPQRTGRLRNLVLSW